MSALEAAIAGAKVGALIGAATGTVPLAVGIFRGRTRAGLGVFAGCIVCGAIGGLYAAIAVMGVGLAAVWRTDKPKAGEPGRGAD